jgi:hypothetical protein
VTLHDIFRTYQIEVQGEVNEETFNATSPLQVMVLEMDTEVTRLAVRTDQSGLIGLLRHLHGQGFVLKSVYRKQGEM